MGREMGYDMQQRSTAGMWHASSRGSRCKFQILPKIGPFYEDEKTCLLGHISGHIFCHICVVLLAGVHYAVRYYSKHVMHNKEEGT